MKIDTLAATSCDTGVTQAPLTTIRVFLDPCPYQGEHDLGMIEIPRLRFG